MLYILSNILLLYTIEMNELFKKTKKKLQYCYAIIYLKLLIFNLEYNI